MADEPSNIELEILAYVDGELGETARRRVEERISASPELAARVMQYQTQDVALRRAYDGAAAEPVPDRLLETLRASRSNFAFALTKAAALILLLLSAGLIGWFAGRGHHGEDMLSYDFVERSYNEYLEAVDSRQSGLRDLAQGESAERDSIRLKVRMPDLSHVGYHLTDRATIDGGSEGMVHLTYKTSRGESFSVFLQPRSEDISSEVEVRREDGVSIASWAAGPLLAAVATRLPPADTVGIVQNIRTALSDREKFILTIEASPLDQGQHELMSGLPEHEGTAAASPRPSAATVPALPDALPN